VAAGHIEIMLHGYTHEFLKIENGWIAECRWKPADRLLREIAEGKRYLEDLLGCSVKVFVPPGNAIGKEGILAVEAAGLDLSGILGTGGDRPWSVHYASAFAKRWAYRVTSGRPYPFPLRVGRHRELVAYSLTPKTDPERLMSDLLRCAQARAPFVLGTHYWEFQKVPAMRNILQAVLAKVTTSGYTPAFVSDCIDDVA
jgi:hypothetical protein